MHSAESADLSPAGLRLAFGAFPSGVAAVAALRDSVPVGLAASSFTSVSLDPPIVSVCMAHTSTTWPVLRRATRIGLSILAEGQHAACRALAARTGDRFADLSWQATDTGAVVIDGSPLCLECTVHAEVPAGDHDIVLLDIHGLLHRGDVAPLVFHRSRFRRLTD
ncbi:flavin reductase family protein [Dactylosporangium fulvum]|uniref:Flavin reductase family protein n=1 Tax=Dactylosporangium fulvum TaxID=53359 RepID=A0ABY5VRF0_9ACTN|nr:flavin reductase family protein [Dactylosporangium fulvum]UWP79767.1 flavin reductase family protein [Dactylosporangium fulvum]